MNKKPVFAIFIAFVVILTMVVPAFAHFDPMTSSLALDSGDTYPVDITDTGFDPFEITIETGDRIEWTNQTTDAVTVKEGEPHFVFLPLIRKSNLEKSTLPQSTPPAVQAGGISILPGASANRVFTAAGTYHFYLLEHPNQTFTVTVIEVKDFSITSDPVASSIYVGESTVYTITVAPINGFNTPLTLDVSGLPMGIDPLWGANPVTPPASTTLTIETTAGTAPGNYPLQVSGTDGVITHSVPVTLTVLGLPDLAVQTVALTPNPAAHDTEVNLAAEIYNLGAGAAPAFTVEWKIFPLGSTTPVDSGSWNVTSLSAGAHTTLNTPYTPVQPGPFTVQVTADPVAALPDPEPANNQKETELGVTGNISFCGNISENTTWAYATYILTCDVDILSGATLTLRNGAVIKPQGTGIQVHGSLQSTGTESAPIVFTSFNDDVYGGDSGQDGTATNPGPGEWSSITIPAGGSASLSHTMLRYGTVPVSQQGGNLVLTDSTVTNSSGVGVQAESTGGVDIQNSMIMNNGSHGIYYTASGSAAPVIRGNGFEANTGYAIYFNLTTDLELDASQLNGNVAMNNSTNGLRLMGTLTGSSVLADAGIPYVLEVRGGYGLPLTVPAGSSLTLLPGVVFKSHPGAYWNDWGTGLEISGTLSAAGTVEQPITFTSIKDDTVDGDTNNDSTGSTPAAGDWTRLQINSGGYAALNHTVIRYSGGALYAQQQDSIRTSGGTLNLQNSTVEWGAGAGVRSDTNGVIDIQDTILRNHTSHGLVYSAGGSGAPVIKNNTFDSNAGYAVYFEPSADMVLNTTGVTGNSANHNTTNGLRLIGTLIGTSTLGGETGLPYVMEIRGSYGSSITVPAGSTLTIQPGAIFKAFSGAYDNGWGTGLEINGTLSAVGMVDQPIIFTSIKDDTYGGDTNNDSTGSIPAAGDWTRLTIGSGGSATLDHLLVRYGGGLLYNQLRDSIRNYNGVLNLQNSTIENGGGSGIRSYASGLIDLQNNLIRGNTEHGIYYAASGSGAPVVNNNTISGNTSYAMYFAPEGDLTLNTTGITGNTAEGNGTNGMRLVGTLTGTSTLGGEMGMPYVLELRGSYGSSITVPAGSTLTIQPGAIFKALPGSYDNGWGTGLEINGTLSAVGTVDQPIIFTSIKDDTYGGDTNNDLDGTDPAAADWTRLTIGSGGSATLDHLLVRYSGGLMYNQLQDSIRNYDGTLNLQNSTVENGGGSGIRSYASGLIDLQNNLIRSNTEHGIYYGTSDSGAPVIKNNTISGNTRYAMYFNPESELSLDTTGISGNTAEGNGTNGLRMVGTLIGTSTLGGEMGMPYVLEVRGSHAISLNVPAGGTLTIQPGAIFKSLAGAFWDDWGTGLDIGGTLTAMGTEDQPIIFTSIKDDSHGGDTNNDSAGSTPAAGDWTRLSISSGGSATLDYLLVRYGGGSLYGQLQDSLRNYEGTLNLQNSTIENGSGSGVRSYSSGLIDLQDNLIRNHTEHGIYYGASGTGAPVVKNNTISGNTSYAIYFAPEGNLTLDTTGITGNTAEENGTNGLRLIGTLIGTSKLGGEMGMPYVLEVRGNYGSSINVPVGETLEIEPGAIFKSLGGAYWNSWGTGFEIFGELVVGGVSGQPVIFTSIHDDSVGGDTNHNADATSPAAGDWTRLYIGSGGTAEFDFTEIRYGGGGLYAQTQEGLRNEGGEVTFFNGIFSNNAVVGLRMNSGNLNVQTSQFDHNPIGLQVSGSTDPISVQDCDFLANTTGIQFDGGTAPLIGNNIFEGNASWGIYNSTGSVINATNNWWGSDTGPTHASNPGGTGDPVSNMVTFSPWLTERPR